MTARQYGVQTHHVLLAHVRQNAGMLVQAGKIWVGFVECEVRAGQEHLKARRGHEIEADLQVEPVCDQGTAGGVESLYLEIALI